MISRTDDLLQKMQGFYTILARLDCISFFVHWARVPEVLCSIVGKIEIWNYGMFWMDDIYNTGVTVRMEAILTVREKAMSS